MFPLAMRAALMAGSSAWTPTRLFASGEIGAWYDPSDLTTMFQDSAGTTPVTAVGQKVGLILDKSQGLALGAELVTNGDFSSGSTGWTVGSNWAVSGGAATATGAVYNTNNLDQLVAFVSGRTYKLTFNVTAYTAGSLRVDIVGVQSVITGGVTAAGAYTYYFVAGITGTPVFRITGSTGGGFTGSIDNISVKELAGNHASQTTDTAKPILSARVNLLTYSEQFDNAAWNKTAISVSTNTTIAPSGAQTADTITCQSGSNNHFFSQAVSAALTAATYTYTLRAKYENHRWFLLQFYDGTNSVFACFDLQNKVVGTKTAGVTSSIEQVFGTDFYTLTLTSSVLAGSGYVYGHFVTSDRITTQVWTAAGTEAVTLWGADLRPANQVNAGMPNYQRIAAATDYDTTGFPYYLSFDGTDDFLVTGTINPGSVDKAQIWAGVRKLSDASSAVIMEWSADIGTINGGVILMGPRSTGAIFSYHSKGTLLSQAISTASFTAPTTNVLTGISDISGDNATLRVNGTVNVAKTDDQGTGNFSSQALYIGSRGGTAARFTGNIYSLIVRFSAANLSDSVISQAETWVNTKTLAY